MKAELIAVGTELLLGNIANTDGQFISSRLSAIGIDVFYHQVVGDNPARFRAALDVAAARSDIIITTGGLGPTYDDLTKETLADYFGKKLVLHQPSLERIKTFFAEIGREMTDNNIKQALLPEGCTVFENDWGTAPGCAFEARGHRVLMLPGPPRECNPMFTVCAEPYLRGLSDGAIVSRTVKVFGRGESEVESLLRSRIEKMDNPSVAPYAKDGEMFLRVTAKAEDERKAFDMTEPVVAELKELLGGAVYGVDVDSLEERVVELLKEKKKTLAVAESCTGGLLSKRITDIPGVSEVYLGGVCSYANEVKRGLLGVREETLEKYGAVSRKTAFEMAKGIRRATGADIGVGITGIAGPGGGTEEKPVGLVYIAVSAGGCTIVRERRQKRSRDLIRYTSASYALNMLRVYLEKLK